MSLDVLLEILGTLERLAAEVALVGLEGHMDANMRGDVIALHCRGSAVAPLASKVEVICALAANMALTHVVLWIEVSISGSRELFRLQWRARK